MRSGKSVASVVAAVLLVCGCQRPGGAGSAPDPAGETVPVTVAKAKRQDVPVYLDGLGTVQALNTATIKAQVSGKLLEVPFKEGDEVHRGDALARIDPRTYQAALDQAIAKKAQDEATLASSKLDLNRYQGLVSDGYVTTQQLDQQKATVAENEAQLQSDVAAIDSARAQLSYCVITAPFDGVVGLRLVDIGNLVQSGDATGIVSLTQIKPISVTFTLPEQSLSQIRAAGSQVLPVLAVDRDNHATLAEGQLLAIDNQVDQTTGTIKLKATFPNQDKALWPGQFVNARLLVRTQKSALVVPTNAVQLGPNGSFVYVVNGHNTVEVRNVTVVQAEAGMDSLSAGLDVGETVVVDGQSRLQAGTKVEFAPAGDGATPSAGTQGSPKDDRAAGAAGPGSR